MSDAEWAVCEPLLPHPARPAGKGGRPSSCCMRDIVDGIPLPHAQWPGMASAARGLPVGLDRVLQGRQVAGHGSTETMHDRLCEQVRGVADRKAVPTAAIIDSQSVKAAEEVARTSRGYDAGKKVNGHYLKSALGCLPCSFTRPPGRAWTRYLKWCLRRSGCEVPYLDLRLSSSRCRFWLSLLAQNLTWETCLPRKNPS